MVSFTEAAKTGLSTKYATFSGRAPRSEYWWFSIVYVIGVAAVAVLAIALDQPAIYLASVVFAVPMLAVSVRRFHDMDHSGWRILINLIPIIGTVVYLIGMTREGDPNANRYGPSPWA